MLWDFEKEVIYRSDAILRFRESSNYGNIMSGRSGTTSNIILTTGPGGSVRQHTNSGLPNAVKFAGEESKDKMYEPKHSKKLIRVLTVIAYMFSVSLAAIMLSVYYVFLWNPKDIHHRTVRLTTPTPIAPPGPACPQTVGANHVEQKAQDISTKMPHSQLSSPSPATTNQEMPTNSTLDHLLNT